MRCIELMERDIQRCAPSDSIVTVARMMRDRDIGIVPVCEDDGRLVGVITDRDLTVRALAVDGSVERMRAADVMTPGVVTCRPTDSLEVAEELMAKHRKGRILCTDEAQYLLGVISLTDLAEVETADRLSRVFRAIAARESAFLLV